MFLEIDVDQGLPVQSMIRFDHELDHREPVGQSKQILEVPGLEVGPSTQGPLDDIHHPLFQLFGPGGKSQQHEAEDDAEENEYIPHVV